jgi:hypothetical protein
MGRLLSANTAVYGILNAVGTGGQLRAKAQLAPAIDALLQVVGNANIAQGSSERVDPLNSPFTVYVNPITGSDTFVGGAFSSFEEPISASSAAKLAAKLNRLENQRLTCGYSPQRPFRTVNRAVIEIIIATSKSYLSAADLQEANIGTPCIVLSPGCHIIYNDPGNSSSAIAVSEWPAAGFDPTPEHLIAFNPNTGGVVVARSSTISAPSGCIIRPSFVPAAADEASDYSNRVAVLKLSSGAATPAGVTFRDRIGASSSHHLLDCLQNASQADLDQLYAKVRTAVGGANNTGTISSALAMTQATEWQTAAAISGAPSEAWDTIHGAAPYGASWSLLTDWGMGGVFWDGDRQGGLKSLEQAHCRATVMQRDLSCWEIYQAGAWRAPVSYQELLDSDPDDVRMKPRRLSRGVLLTNDAIGALHAVDVTGAGAPFVADRGAHLVGSSSATSLGGCVAVARGYQRSSAPLDAAWNLRRLRVARSVADQSGNVIKIPLGVVAAISSGMITLQAPLAASSDPAIPATLAGQGYSLAAGTLVWIENPSGADWRATLASNAWASTAPAEIDITAAAVQAGTGAAIGTASGVSLAIGQAVYIRRLADSRSSSDRQVSLKLSNSTSARVPPRNSILQTQPAVAGAGIARSLVADGAEVLAVTTTRRIQSGDAGVVLAAEITIRRSCPEEPYTAGGFYRQGQVVKHAGKHWTARSTFVASGAAPDETRWQESHVAQESAFNAADPITLEGPALIFDTDTDGASDVTTTCGINWSTIYTNAGSVRDQLRNATDYRGALALLLALGFTSTAAHNALVPRPQASRELDPASAVDFPTAPTGGAASGRANWALEFRQPSTVQLTGHRFHAVGFWNLSRGLPRGRRPMSDQNEFSATGAAVQGGRVEIRGVTTNGFEVTNQGLINIDTGELVTVAAIGVAAEGS